MENSGMNPGTEKNSNRTMMWIAGGCLALILCGVAVAALAFGGLFWIGSRSPDNAAVQVNAPINVSVGDDVEVRITVSNTTDTSLEVSSIDFSMNFLDGFNVYQVDPPYSESSQYEALGGGETFQSYYFHRSVGPGETLTLVFSAQAVTPGDFSGNIDVCIDSDFNCVSNIARTVIE